MMLPENCYGNGCQTLIGLLVYREAVLGEEHLHNVRIILIDCQMQSIHAMLRNIKQINFLLSKHDHDANESLLCCDPESIDPFKISHINIEMRILQ